MCVCVCTNPYIKLHLKETAIANYAFKPTMTKLEQDKSLTRVCNTRIDLEKVMALSIIGAQ